MIHSFDVMMLPLWLHEHPGATEAEIAGRVAQAVGPAATSDQLREAAAHWLHAARLAARLAEVVARMADRDFA